MQRLKGLSKALNRRETYWRNYYKGVFTNSQPWLDLSNAKVQAHTHALVLEAAGSPLGAECLDVGCGYGQLSMCMWSLGAHKVVGIDLVEEFISRNTVKFPQICWKVGTLRRDLLQNSQRYDIVLLTEVLQYMNRSEALRVARDLLRSGGRIVATVPNGNCPIVRRSTLRFSGNFLPPSMRELKSEVRSLPGNNTVLFRGLSFSDNQTIMPYKVSAWSLRPIWDKPPNRIQLVVVRNDD